MNCRVVFVTIALLCGSTGCRDADPTVEPETGKKPSVTIPPASSAQKVRVPSKPKEGVSPRAKVPVGRHFYGVYVSGHKIGWAEEVISQTSDGTVRVGLNAKLQIRRQNEQMVFNVNEESDYSPLPAGRLLRTSSSEAQGTAPPVRRAGVVRDGKLKLTVTSGGTSKTHSLPAPKRTLRDVLPNLVIERLQKAGGKPITAWDYDFQMMRDLPLEVTLISEKKTRVRGVPVVILTVKAVDKTRGITSTQRFSRDGLRLEAQLGAALKMVLEEKAVAQNPLVSVPDFFELSVVRIKKRLGVAEKVRQLTVKLSGLPDSLSLQDPRQSVTDGTLVVRKLTLSELPFEKLAIADREKWLAATVLIDHNSPAIKERVGALTLGSSSVKRVRSLMRSAHEALAYSLATAPMTASQILAGGSGDCSEYSRLMVAMARGAGIPAREVAGMVYAGDDDPGFAFHAWVEVYVDGKWMAADPTWNQLPIDATHITLSRHDLTSIIGVFGSIKAEVIAVK